MSKELSLQETGAMLLAAEKIVLCTHVSPDGDTLGSTLGLARFLLAQGKQVTVFCDDVINKSFSFIPGIELCERPVEGSKLQTDLLVVIDASSFDRIGLVSEVVEAKNTAEHRPPHFQRTLCRISLLGCQGSSRGRGNVRSVHGYAMAL